MPTFIYVAGSLLAAIGLLSVLALIEDKTEADAIIAAAGIISGVFFLGLAYALQKLTLIEHHLNPSIVQNRANVDAKQEISNVV